MTDIYTALAVLIADKRARTDFHQTQSGLLLDVLYAPGEVLLHHYDDDGEQHLIDLDSLAAIQLNPAQARTLAAELVRVADMAETAAPAPQAPRLSLVVP